MASQTPLHEDPEDGAPHPDLWSGDDRQKVNITSVKSPEVVHVPVKRALIKNDIFSLSKKSSQRDLFCSNDILTSL